MENGGIYIAGKITGTNDYLKRFAKAERWLSENGYIGRVVNPARIGLSMPRKTSYKDYIRMGLSLLDKCDSIFMLNGWEESAGASLELLYAVTLGYNVFFEEG